LQTGVDHTATLLIVTESLAVLKTEVAHLKTSSDDHRTRIRAIEKKVWVASGVIIAAGVIGSIVERVVSYYLKK
jgi:hypothetical protein